MTRTSISLSLVFLTLAHALAAVSQDAHPTRLLLRLDNISRGDLLHTGLVSDDAYRPGNLISYVMDTAWVIVSTEQREDLRRRGIEGETVMEHRDSLLLVRRAMYGPNLRLEPPYHTYESLQTELEGLQKRYPERIRLSTIGTTTAGRRAIRAVTLAANVRRKDNRPAILLNGCHHSDEILGAEICMKILTTFASSYGKDPEITRWMDLFEITVIPVLNVDGYVVVTSGEDPRWRKNRRETTGDGMLDLRDGVDINRNYDFNWAHGGSGDPESERYRGPYPFSESENRAFASLARSKRFLASLTYHSQGEVIFYPWTWKGRKAPDDSLLTLIARSVAESIPTMRGDSTYRAEYGAGLVGQSYPWLYGALGTLDFVVETGRGASFPPAHYVPGIVDANMLGVREFLRRAEGPAIRVSVLDRRTRKPVDAEVWLPAVETEDVHRRTTRPGTGVYHRLVLPGTYTVIVRAPGYSPLVITDVRVAEKGVAGIRAELVRTPGE